ncbi:hypothetical protein ARMSODRAFT_980624 [Armillaria solidipes]|uniref:Uncharacterized protein n=1 Tax=Armillaria solidipes TaxID=1076256 RepID=A0A2H3AV18_9AGAR|nr:hypothetical protein ARMSODRAFT_980624 [Armillaria solidipes]
MHVPSPDLSQDEKSALFGELDTYLNALILESWFHVVTLWTILTATKRLHGPFLHTIIIMLYVLRTLAFVMEWTFERHAFIENGYNDYSVFAALMGNDLWWRIWRCWMLWDCQWPVVLIPIMFLVAATVMKAMQMFSDIRTVGNNISESVSFATEIDWPLIYIVLSLTTTLMCTLFIVYRIVRFAHRLLLFRRIISALIESAMIYTLTLTAYLALVGTQMTTAYYADIVATYARAIAPTLLALRVATGSTSISSDEESNTSGNISDICFRPMGENYSSSNPSEDTEESFSESHGTRTVESV